MLVQIKVILFLCLLKFSKETDHKPCIPRSYGLSSVVCICNATYCDNIPQPNTMSSGEYLSYVSTASGLRFKLEKGTFQSIPINDSGYTIINLDSEKKYQTVSGWGGAFTDATGVNINALRPAAADYLLKSYFSEEGIEYNLCRVPIGGTDFSTHAYSYNDGNADPQLLNFKLAPADYIYKIPLIKIAQNLTNGKLELFASAWTAPKWMKNNEKYTGPGTIKKSMYQAWASYHLKFLTAYNRQGIDFWGITTGNEPSMGLTASKISSVGWHGEDMSKWVKENLGPTIRNSNFSSIKILGIDDQIFQYPLFIEKMFQDDKVKEYVDGFGLHWYLNKHFPSTLMSEIHNKYPNKIILATEACEGSEMFEDHVLLGEWKRAETYAEDIINDLNNWVTGWIDWNMAVDITGGPSYIGNSVDSPIVVNVAAGEFYKQPMYYSLGHFAKFVPKGSERISTAISNKNLNVVAFCRPDNMTAVVILNMNTYEIPIKLNTKHASGGITKIILAKSINTLLY